MHYIRPFLVPDYGLFQCLSLYVLYFSISFLLKLLTNKKKNLLSDDLIVSTHTEVVI